MPQNLRDDELRFPHVERLTASAGSGKTHALARRYVQFLLSDRVPESGLSQLLAVTFTNKAAKEMRDRILEWLKAVAFREEGKAAIRAQVRDSLAHAASLEARCDHALERLFEQWPDFSVKTIDAFLLALAQGSAYELGLPPRGKVVLDCAPYLEEALDQVLDRSASDEELARELERAVLELVATRPEIGWELGGELSREQGALESLAATSGLTLLESPEALGDFLRLRAAAQEHAGRIAEGLLAAGAEFRGKGFLQKLAAFGRTGDFKDVASSKMIQAEELAGALKGGAQVDPELARRWGQMRRQLEGAAMAWARAQAQPHLRLRTALLPFFEEAGLRDGAVFLQRLPALFSGFLERCGVPAAYFTWGERVRHFLLDEFQDTSDTQWAAFLPLVEEALSKGGSVFYVGDRKQAIYRFRGGRAELFDRAREDLAAFHFHDEALTTNYRSREALVSFFNEVFSRDNLMAWAEEAAPFIAPGEFDGKVWPVFDRAAQAAKSPGGFVRVETRTFAKGVSYDEALAEVADRAAAELLPDLLSRGFRHGDVAVLLRDNRHASIVSRRFLEAGIPVASSSTLALPAAQSARELVALLRWLDSPVDDLAFATFATGDIFTGASCVPPGAIFAFLNEKAGARGTPLYRAFRERFPEVWAKLLQPLFSAVGYLPPYDLVHQALGLLGVLERNPGREMVVYHLLEVLRQREGEGENALGQFLRFWDENPDDPSLEVPLPEGGDAVRVLTIHKAKGLGFPAVLLLLPFLSDRPVASAAVREPDGIRLLRFTKAEESLCPELAELRRLEKVEALRDELNAFYVALTRAALELRVVLGRFEDGRAFSQKRRVPLPDEAVIGRPESPGRALAAEPSRFPAGRPAAADWRSRMLPRRQEGYQPPPGAALEAERRGTLVHLALSFGMAGSDEDAARLVALGAAEKDARDAAALLRRLAAHPAIGPLIRPPHGGRVENELTLLDERGRLFRVDRLIEIESTLTVVDWKTGGESAESHREQVANYCRLLSRIYPDRGIRGLLCYLDEGRTVEVPW
jgi:ATP-dependent helicase/nuclease subunit A